MLYLTGKCRDSQGRECRHDGVMRLVDPNGLVVPGVFMCQEHAAEFIKGHGNWAIFDVRGGGLQEVLDALQNLFDWQNGPPLATPKYIEGWGTAMEMAKSVLAKHGRLF